MIISSSGYYSTGSSAVYVLLKEYQNSTEGLLENWEIKSHEYENILLYSPNSIFDLEDKLLVGNSIHRSDEAIRSFYKEMRRLNDNRYIWCGDFQRLLGNEWMNAVNHFIKSLVKYEVPSHWAYHYGDEKLSLRKFLGSIKRKIKGIEIQGSLSKWPAYNADELIKYSFPEPDEFYLAAYVLINRYFDLLRGSANKEKDLILNHFVLPHNLHRLERYFDEDEIKVIVVDRDPRDVFVMEKYRTRQDHSRIPCDDVQEFVNFWKRLRDTEKPCDSRQVIRIQFEDLIYKYDSTVSYIEERCGFHSDNHLYKKEFFSPEKSMYNTQLFKCDSKWNSEITYIEENLGDYLYDFPEDSIMKERVTADQYGIYVC